MFGYEKPNSAYKKITIKEVARASGVSIKTISRVLNQRPDVAPETRGHVLRIINKMGFSPNALARGMVRQRSLTIGILSSSLNMNGTALALDGIFAEADSLGYTLLLKELSDLDIDQTDRLLRSLLDYRVDGIIWAFPRAERDIQGFMGMELPVPIVFLSQNQLPTYTTVTLDYYKSGYLATLHLIEQG
jgi:LacI family transcriptional regulator